MSIHPTAVVHPKARIDPSATIGPYAILGEHLEIGANVEVASHVVMDGWTRIGEGSVFYPYCSIGLAPQDFKYQGEPTRLLIGRQNVFREYVTVHRGTPKGGSETVIGDHNYFMAYAHVAHDSQIGNHVTLANAATLGGHIVIGDYAILGGLVAVHQFVRIGDYAMIGGGAIVIQDVPPYLMVSGNHARLYGINRVGLKRHGFSQEQVEVLKAVYRLLFRSGLLLKTAIQEARMKWGHRPEVAKFLSFVEHSKRGICR